METEAPDKSWEEMIDILCKEIEQEDADAELEHTLSGYAQEDPSFQEITKQAVELREQIQEDEKALKVKKEQFASVSEKVLKHLEALDIEKVQMHGYLFFKERKTSVTIPKTLEEKQQLFKFLEEKGLFLEMVSVNSQTLNSLYKSLAQDALAEGVLDFKLPGVAEPVNFVNLKLRRS